MAKIRRSKSKKKVVLKVPEIVELAGLKFGKLGNSWYATNSKVGTKLKSDFIRGTKKAAVHSLLLQESGCFIIANITLAQLEAWVKRVKKDAHKCKRKYKFDSFLRHLSPDLTFHIKL